MRQIIYRTNFNLTKPLRKVLFNYLNITRTVFSTKKIAISVPSTIRKHHQIYLTIGSSECLSLIHSIFNLNLQHKQTLNHDLIINEQWQKWEKQALIQNSTCKTWSLSLLKRIKYPFSREIDPEQWYFSQF